MSSLCYSHVRVCRAYVTRMYSYVILMSLVCTRMSFVCHSYVLVCHHLYVTRMYSYVIRMSLVWTRMSFVYYSYVLVCHPYVTRMWFYHEPVLRRLIQKLKFLFTKFDIFSSSFGTPFGSKWPNKTLRNKVLRNLALTFTVSLKNWFYTWILCPKFNLKNNFQRDLTTFTFRGPVTCRGPETSDYTEKEGINFLRDFMEERLQNLLCDFSIVLRNC